MFLIVIPVFNEELAIKPLVLSINNVMKSSGSEYKLIFIDDGSTDSSYEKILDLQQKDYPIHIIKHKTNMNLAHSIQDGFRYTCDIGKSGDYIIRLDGDGSHDPKYIPFMLAQAQASNADIVILSRFKRGGKQIGVPLGRKMLSIAASSILQLLFAFREVKDLTCGYRLYKIEAVQKSFDFYGTDFIELKNYGFVATFEKLLKLRKLGCQVAEIPGTIRYDLKKSKSKMNIKKTMLGYLVLFLKNFRKRKQ